MYGVFIDHLSISRLIENFKILTGINIAFVTRDLKNSIQPSTHGRCKFCRILQTDGRADARCKACDHYAFNLTQSTKRFYLYECHAGLTEAVAPLIVEDKLLGYLVFGQVLAAVPSQELWDGMLKRNSGYDIDYGLLEKAFYELENRSLEKIKAAAEILEMSAKYIFFSGLVAVREPALLQKLKLFIEMNLDKPVSISEASKSLGVSKSHLSHIIRAQLNCTFTDFLNKKRMEKASRLLSESTYKINEISMLCGYPDQNYFSRMFRRITGLTPSKFRMEMKSKAELC